VKPQLEIHSELIQIGITQRHWKKVKNICEKEIPNSVHLHLFDKQINTQPTKRKIFTNTNEQTSIRAYYPNLIILTNIKKEKNELPLFINFRKKR